MANALLCYTIQHNAGQVLNNQNDAVICRFVLLSVPLYNKIRYPAVQI